MTHQLPKKSPPTPPVQKWMTLLLGKFSFAFILTIICLSNVNSYAQQSTITGKVTGDKNEGLPGVTI